ncbi:FAD-dependent oxidoreductase [Polycladidibacter stylochi]|uniref:FAD-dependent oxidoreductase n=1 Tax=Polycladidibacter stylochi TaxID=1807766 RepID=UPI0008319B26|nr:FAD-dependent oxidoreductase [Pseudovibrio stylochi]
MGSQSVVTVRFEDEIAFVEVNNPPVNVTSQAVRAGLLQAVETVNAQSGVKAAVLFCAGSTFIAGGDITEFGTIAKEPHLPDVVSAIERSVIPFIAAMHGTVLGGGFEIALGCAFRIADAKTRFGFPEVNIGLIPGAGGTQRLPRLIGALHAIDMCALGVQLNAEKLYELGGLDLVTGRDLLVCAKEFVENMPERPVALSQQETPYCLTADFEGKRTQIEARSKGASAPFHNYEAVKWSCEFSFSEATQKERALHLALRDSAESRALRHAFFAEKTAAKPAILKEVEAKEINAIAVVGGGLMGSGIALSALMAGLEVIMLERDAQAAEAGAKRVAGLIEGAVKRGKVSAEKSAKMLEAYRSSHDYSDAAHVDLAVEAVFEDLEVKRAVFAKLAPVVSEKTILATNTSYIDPMDIFEGIDGAERCIGMHFFSPAHIMKLLEVVQLPTTGKQTLASALQLGKRLRKTSVVSGICDGFIGNRMLAAFRRQADYLLADGCLPEQIDAALRRFGMPMGPFELQDLTGLQIAWANRKRQAATRPTQERYIPFGDLLCEKEHFGQRSGRGWYQYVEGERKPLADPEVEDMIMAWSARQGVVRQTFTGDEITERMLAVLVNEGFCILEEGIAERSQDVDLVQLHGYGFPRWRGGPMQYAQEVGIERIASAMQRVAEQSPQSWEIAKALS